MLFIIGEYLKNFSLKNNRYNNWLSSLNYNYLFFKKVNILFGLYFWKQVEVQKNMLNFCKIFGPLI